MLLFDDDLLDNETDFIKSDGKRSIYLSIYLSNTINLRNSAAAAAAAAAADVGVTHKIAYCGAAD